MAENRIDRDRRHGAGARTWYFPDGDRPPSDAGPLEAHESLMVLNVSDRPAHLELDLYWEDREPTMGINVQIGTQRVRSLRVPWWEDPADAGDGAMISLLRGEWGEVKTLAAGTVGQRVTKDGETVPKTTDLRYFSRLTTAE